MTDTQAPDATVEALADHLKKAPEASAEEWRGAYFALADICQKQLQKARATGEADDWARVELRCMDEFDAMEREVENHARSCPNRDGEVTQSCDLRTAWDELRAAIARP